LSEPQLADPWKVTWERFHADARALAALLKDKGPFSTLVAVSRGGLAPAAIIARELDLRCVETISIASYDEKVQGKAHILKTLAPDIVERARDGGVQGGSVLVIDDLADSGETLRLVRKLLPQAHVATLYVKPIGKPQVDTFVGEVAQECWIYFPWDLE